MILERAQLARYLAMAREVADGTRLYDLHVSPYEVIFDQPEEDPCAPYHAPALGPLRVIDARARDAAVPTAMSAKLYRSLYAHAGPRTVADHMALSGITTSLLVPVARVGTDGAQQLRWMFERFPQRDDRFAFGYCPPTTVPIAELGAHVAAIAARFPLAALKVHPNLQAIDLATDAGRERLEAVLDAGQALHLPVMVHGGRSTVVAEGGTRASATLDRLESIAWRRARVPVILGHAGLFGCSRDEVAASLPRLRHLLATNDNVVIEISGLGFDTLCTVLDTVDRARIVFGSDALYFPQWGALATLLHALCTLAHPPAEALEQIAGTTPATILRRPMEAPS